MSNLSPELEAQRKKMQMEIMLKESDVKKNERMLIDIEIGMRDLKHKQTQLQSEFMFKENQYKKIEADHLQLQAELIKLKHQMINLGR